MALLVAKMYVYGHVLMAIFLSWKCTHASEFPLSDFCGRTLDMKQRGLSEVVLKLSNYATYWSNVKCDMTIVTSPGSRLSFRILQMTLSDCGDMVSLYGDSTNSSDNLYAHMCSMPAHVYDLTTPGSTGTVTFTSNTEGNTGGFKILITSFYNVLNDACSLGYFKCKNRRCIKSGLSCNQRDNCGDNSDESGSCKYRSGKKKKKKNKKKNKKKKNKKKKTKEKDDNSWWIPVVGIIAGICILLLIWHAKKKHDIKVKARAAANAQKKKIAPAKSTSNTPKPNQQTPKADKKTGATQSDSKAPKETKEADDTKDTVKAETVSGASTPATIPTQPVSSARSPVPLVDVLTREAVPPVTNTTPASTVTPATSQLVSAPQIRSQNVPTSAMYMGPPMYVHVIPISQPYSHMSQSPPHPNETPPSYLNAMSGPPIAPPMFALADSFPLQVPNTMSRRCHEHGDYIVDVPVMEQSDTKPSTTTSEKSDEKY